jgi:hypothetical protein
MHEAVFRLLTTYPTKPYYEYDRPLREITQSLALLGLWRAKFFDKAALRGGTALRIMYGLDRFSKDLDFSLIAPKKGFELARYMAAMKEELSAFGFNVQDKQTDKEIYTVGKSAFLKEGTLRELLVIETVEEIRPRVQKGKVVKIKLEVDTDPPSGISTEIRYLLSPIPFAVRVSVLPDLFAGTMHAVLCQNGESQSQGEDWYDFVWCAINHPELNLTYLEQRMRQSGHWQMKTSLTLQAFQVLLSERIDQLDIDQARYETRSSVMNPEILSTWSLKYFRALASRIREV